MRRYQENETAALAEILKRDGVISVPTDTVYGVCACMNSIQAQENLRGLKHRPETKAFPVMCADLDQVRTIAQVDDRAARIIHALMPGPVTVILPKLPSLPDYVNGGMDTLAIRLATGPAVKRLIEETGCPLFMTSANQSGEPVCTTLDEIEKSCPGLDGMMVGAPAFGKASTIIDCTGPEIRILRQGPVTMADIEAALQQN